LPPRFRRPGRSCPRRPLATGPINETSIAIVAAPGGERRYVSQKINHRIFNKSHHAAPLKPLPRKSSFLESNSLKVGATQPGLAGQPIDLNRRGALTHAENLP
jgi:hypothetical protein